LGVKVNVDRLPGWLFAPENEGTGLLSGTRTDVDLGVIMEFERSIEVFVDTRQYIAALRDGFGNASGMQLLDASLAPGGVWGSLRYSRDGYEQEAWISISERQGTMLRVNFVYPPGQRRAVEHAIHELMQCVDTGGVQ
jgi:hypothetical protein